MNVAYGVARLGGEVHFFTSVGDDDAGRLIVSHLLSADVRLIPGSVVHGPTATAVASLDHAGAASYDFDIRWQLPSSVDWPDVLIVHTGSIGAILEPGASAVLGLVTAARKRSLISFDPNIRPSLIPDADHARQRFIQFASCSDVVKLSDEDAAWLYPGEAIDILIDRILAWGPTLVAVTLGPDGAILATAGARVAVPGVRVVVVDSIGAGDSFMSAMICQLARLLTDRAGIDAFRRGSVLTAGHLSEIGEFATTCAAISVSRVGADLPSLEDLAGWMSTRWR